MGRSTAGKGKGGRSSNTGGGRGGRGRGGRHGASGGRELGREVYEESVVGADLIPDQIIEGLEDVQISSDEEESEQTRRGSNIPTLLPAQSDRILIWLNGDEYVFV